MLGGFVGLSTCWEGLLEFLHVRRILLEFFSFYGWEDNFLMLGIELSPKYSLI